ncbi:NAD(P)/FAD-dependent oxidoreductase [Leptospira ognonensis]|uniref:NAD(P)/FAD-dependent oxidoreductase n=1 Tax=Leptospira ognonensis TaxID=2484945 RepID=A0A4R9K529_9LEPT|nr:NAD(P)/FAD-dependent oxidoreductase [Leptospira ognonensis]TGL59367.1 NAD(P)/FAD-dependent oxidoreductase [Leptospira ognonensis]
MKPSQTQVRLAILGGGASGCFAAIQAHAFSNGNIRITIFEKSREPLSKLKVSGGGRCNVTHQLFDPEELAKKYPRGEKELRWAFETFQPKDTIEWFGQRNVPLKVEADGRMFPVSDDSQTIIDCLIGEIKDRNIKLLLDENVVSVHTDAENPKGRFRLRFADDREEFFDIVLIATGSNRKVWNWMEALGHSITLPVPSLFTLGIENSDIITLSGLSVPHASIRILPKGKAQIGPLLITHWGFSGPAALRLSAFEARVLFDAEYKVTLEINWLGDRTSVEVEQMLLDLKVSARVNKVMNQKLNEIPNRLWEWFLIQSHISTEKKWADVSKQEIKSLTEILCRSKFQMIAKGVFKEEFVTAGGISRKDIDFKSMQSRKIENLYFTGEVIDIDGITGGFNFQNAWTTATLAAKHIASLVI